MGAGEGPYRDALLAMPFKAAYMFRPGAILPLDGIRPKSQVYDLTYRVLTPLVGLLRAVRPNWIPHTRDIGKACSPWRRASDPTASSTMPISSSWRAHPLSEYSLAIARAAWQFPAVQEPGAAGIIGKTVKSVARPAL